MRKIIYIFLFALVVSVFNINASEEQNVGNVPNKIDVEQGFFDTLHEYIGKGVSVYLSDVDIILRGELIKVFSDGMMIKNFFKQTIFISKSSVSYIEIKELKDLDVKK